MNPVTMDIGRGAGTGSGRGAQTASGRGANAAAPFRAPRTSGGGGGGGGARGLDENYVPFLESSSSQHRQANNHVGDEDESMNDFPDNIANALVARREH